MTGRPGPAGSSSGAPAPGHVTQGLLERVADGALDADYAVASRRRARTEGSTEGSAPPRGRARAPGLLPHPPHPGRRLGVLGVLVLAVLGAMLAVSALSTTRSAEVTAAGRAELISQVKAGRARLDDLRRQQAADVAEVAALRGALLTTTTSGRRVAAEVARLGVLTGAAAATGPGLDIVVDDAPDASTASQHVYDKDLQRLVNALWQSGAEAIAINGQRLTALSAIRTAGENITVNFRPLNRPYTVQVLGDANDIQARFVNTGGGQAWFDLVNSVGLRFDVTARDSLTLPASSRVDLRFATVARPGRNAS